MLYDLPCSSKLSSRPPQLPFTAPSSSIAFHCSGDESGLWQRGLENRGTANPLLPAQANAAPTLRGPGGTLAAGATPARSVPRPACPVRVCKTISLIFRLAWQIAAAPCPELLSAFAQVPVSIREGFSIPPRRVFQG